MQNQNILMCFGLHIPVNSSDIAHRLTDRDNGSKRLSANALRGRASRRSLARAALATVILSVTLSGCGTFCGAAGGSGGGFGGGCSTGVRF
jgi:hypothetical protein